MSYTSSRGVYVNAKVIDISPGTLTTAATTYSAVTELEDTRVVTLTLTSTAISASDTLDVTIQSSIDGVTWYTAGTFTQVATTPGTQTKDFICGRFMRAQFVVAGAAVTITATLRGEAV